MQTQESQILICGPTSLVTLDSINDKKASDSATESRFSDASFEKPRNMKQDMWSNPEVSGRLPDEIPHEFPNGTGISESENENWAILMILLNNMGMSPHQISPS